MTTLTQLQAMAVDVAAAISASDAAAARLAARLAKLPASADIERRLLLAQAAHQAHQRKALSARSGFLSREAARVQGGGTSAALSVTTSVELSPQRGITPVGRGAISA